MKQVALSLLFTETSSKKDLFDLRDITVGVSGLDNNMFSHVLDIK